MRQRTGVSTAVWGLLSILAGALMAEGGVMEVVVYWAQGLAANVAVGALGALASAALLVSGVAFLTRRPFGRKAAMAGAIGMIPVHLVGSILGFIGVPGALIGIAYPALLLLVLGARPNLGAPVYTGDGAAQAELPPPSDHARRRTSLGIA